LPQETQDGCLLLLPADLRWRELHCRSPIAITMALVDAAGNREQTSKSRPDGAA
jgi:hypothetical protein